MDGFLHYLSGLLSLPEGPRSTGEIIGWWESRRLAYNIVLIACAIGMAWLAGRRRQGNAFWPCLAFIALVLVLPANLWYTLGWLSEIGVAWLLDGPVPQYGPIVLVVATGFSALFLVVVCSLLFLM